MVYRATRQDERYVKLLRALVELPPDERLGFVDSHCRAEPELRARLAETLAFDGEAEDFLNQPLPEVPGSAYLRRAPQRNDAPDDLRQVPEHIGKYRVLGELGAGGQAVSYRAIHPELEREVVIKLSRHTIHEDSEARERFCREARLLADIQHPHVARVHDFDLHEHRPYLVLEYIRGRTLHDVARHKDIPPRRAASIVSVLARALGEAHRRGIVHRDIKPQNIILAHESGRAYLIDFGIAVLQDAWSDGGEERGSISGTVEFMSPEQARGETERMGPPSDIFSLGGVLYYLLTGETPFTSLEGARSCDLDIGALKRNGVPTRLRKACVHAMAAEPENRYPRAQAMADDLDASCHPPRLAMGLSALVLVALAICFVLAPSGEVPESSGFQVFRDGHELRLLDAVPLRQGDAIALRMEVPREVGAGAALFWFDTEGKLQALSPVSVAAEESSLVLNYPDPSVHDVIELAGPPGTEIIFCCAGTPPPREKDITDLFDSDPWPEIPSDSTLRLRSSGVEHFGSRGPGAGRRLEAGVRARAEELQRDLSMRFSWVSGWVFPHR